MSLSILVGGNAECGPSNPLQSLSKRFDQDRGVQQDAAGTSRPWGHLSSEAPLFRSQNAPVPGLQQEAARFFGAGPVPLSHASQAQLSLSTSVGSMLAQPFDMAGLRDALPTGVVHGPGVVSPAPVQREQMGGGVGSAAWAADFLAHRPMTSQIQTLASTRGDLKPQERVQDPTSSSVSASVSMSRGGLQSGALPWSPGHAGLGMSPMTGMAGTMALPVQRHIVQSDQISWDKEFQSQESLLNASIEALSDAVQEQQQQLGQQNENATVPADELARFAAQVIDSVKHEQNPKFRNSTFMNLMRQLRDGEVVVEEDKIVATSAATTTGVDMKGKGRAVETHDVATPSFPPHSRVLPSYQGSEALNAENVGQAVDPHEAYFRQENADYIDYWNAHYKGPAAARTVQEDSAWYEMQRDWDAFETTTTGVRPISNYQFQTNNPYLLGDSSRTRHHALHMSHSQRAYEGVLELEAAVQRDTTNATAWFELGVKQQENEREAKALQALERAVNIDPSYLEAWLALAVSYTNNNHRLGTYDAIREWVSRHPKYQTVVSGAGLAAHVRGNFPGLIDVLIQLARHSDQQGGGVDADVQVALGVLLNTTEEYSKAVDCFLTALAVRPDDWLLYNRVGATMANSRRATDALEYYLRALELNPAYIRARFNLGISCIDLRRYEEATSHILDALILQDSDGVRDEAGLNDARGVTSSTLWESLKTTCLYLQRADLASMCDRRDLDGLRNAFEGA